MASSDLPPPTYSTGLSTSTSTTALRSASNPQLVIVPAPDAVQFQRGNLGADGERAALEGEVQLKGFNMEDWQSLTISFKTIESAANQSVELSTTELVLWGRDRGKEVKEAYPFSISLTPDVPQAIRTPVSSISHTLSATLAPISPQLQQPYVKSVPVPIRRFTSLTSPAIHTAPRSLIMDRPTNVQIQLPRPIFRAGEMIPIYLTVPPPADPSTLGQLQLRNVMVDLVRYVKIGPVNAKAPEKAAPVGGGSYRVSQGVSLRDDSLVIGENGYPKEKGATSLEPPSLEDAPPVAGPSSSTPGHGVHEEVVTRSGAACRLNTRRAVQLRLVLPTAVTSNPDNEDQALPPDVDTSGGSITQSTLMHDVSFCVHVQVTFVDRSTHSSTLAEGTVPIIIVPALAPEASTAPDDLEMSYMKKHDKPPTRTTRMSFEAPDEELEPPSFDDPSGVLLGGYGAPVSAASGSASIDPPPFSAEPGGLPTFLESQAASGPSGGMPEQTELRFDGEGTLFGFVPEEQYDGLSHSMSMPGAAEVAAAVVDGLQQPPPPPAVDDPMDLPPTISGEEAAPQGSENPGGPPPYLGAPGGGAAPAMPPSYLDSR